MIKQMIKKINGEYYDFRCKDSGFPHAEDKGLWRASKVKLDNKGHWFVCDDNDYIITDDMRIVAKETGWRLIRIKI